MADDEMQTPDDESAADDAVSDETMADDVTPEALAEDVSPEAVADDASPEAVANGAPEDIADVADAAAADDEPAASGGSTEISQADIDALLADQGDTPEPAAPGRSAGGGATEVDGGAETLLGDHVAALAPFGVRANETLSLGVESAMGQVITIANTSVVAAEYSEIEAEFTAIPHLGFELRLSLSETESHLVGALIPLPDAGALFSIDTSPDQMADETFAAAQLEAAAGTMRELLDLISLTLFTEGLSSAEVTLSDQRVDMPEFTMGIVADVAQGAAPLRIDLVLALPGGIPVTLTLVVPSSLAIRIAETLVESEAAAPAELLEPVPISAGVTIEPPAIEFEAPAAVGGDAAFAGQPAARPAATIGASPNVDVHPVRFPPLPQMQQPAANHRGFDLILDVQMRVAVELGRSMMTVEDVLSLGPGSVVELNKLAGEAVDILVNERLIARGEVVVVDENFGVRVTEIVSPRRRTNAMGA